MFEESAGGQRVFGEENLLSLALDRYDDESIVVHEFAHTINGTLHSMDSTWSRRLRSVYRNALANGKYEGVYASSNYMEYWAETVQAYFDCNRVNNWNHGPVGDREALRNYDPDGYHLVETTLKIPPDKDWRYQFPVKHPIVIDPPSRFKLNPYYTKFSWAREFVVVGREATDEQIVRANQLIRHLFAYRHDILKVLIHHEAKLVVLGKNETMEDLPDWPKLQQAGVRPQDRFAPFHPDTNTMVVDGSRLAAPPETLNSLGNPVVHAMTDAFYQLTADRAEDPDWEKRGNELQQYELHVDRLDERFGKKVRQCWAAARERWTLGRYPRSGE